MDPHPMPLLLIDDDEDDFLLTRSMLGELQGLPFQLDWISNYPAALDVLGENKHIAYLLDYRLKGHTGLELMREARLRGCRGPFIFLTGQGERELDVEAMKAGAADYLIKGHIDSSVLERSIRYAIERHRAREALHRAHDELEGRIKDRTAALEQANEALRVEIADRQRAERALMEADRRKDEFLAMLAHELRNPLAPIRNGLYILRSPQHDDEMNERVIHMMDQEVRNLTRLVDDLLDVSRITRGKIQLRNETVDLAVAVNHAVEAVRPLIDAHRHQLAVSLPSEPVHLNVDPTRLEQILCNLLNNAAKYTETGGGIHLTVGVHRHTASTNGEGASAETTYVTIRIRDTGIGITPELLPRIFDLFTQADKSLARSQGGLGVGLTIVQKLLVMMGGSVTAHSEGAGKGSEFVVRLPVIAEKAAVKPPQPAAPRSAANPLRVLIVEDIEDVAEMLMVLLKMWGHEVRTAHDGPAALIAARTFRPDVLLLDIGLPGMNGYDVARQLRQESGTKHAMIVAMTGYGRDEDRLRSAEAGFDHHMVKPIDPKALEAFLANVERKLPGAKPPVVSECVAIRQ